MHMERIQNLMLNWPQNFTYTQLPTIMRLRWQSIHSLLLIQVERFKCPSAIQVHFRLPLMLSIPFLTEPKTYTYILLSISIKKQTNKKVGSKNVKCRLWFQMKGRVSRNWLYKHECLEMTYSNLHWLPQQNFVSNESNDAFFWNTLYFQASGLPRHIFRLLKVHTYDILYKGWCKWWLFLSVKITAGQSYT